MKSINSPSQKAVTGAEPPSLVALEAAAHVRLAQMPKGSTRQPSAQAIAILAKMMANRRRRVLLAAQSDKTKAKPPSLVQTQTEGCDVVQGKTF